MKDRYWPFLLVMIFLLVASSLAPGLAAAPDPTRTPTRTATLDLRTRTPTPTRTPLTFALRRQLEFGLGGGGGFAWAFECEAAMKAYAGSLPALLAGKRTLESDQVGAICLAGLRVDKTLLVTLRVGADRRILSQASFAPGESGLDDVRRSGFFLDQIEPRRVREAGQYVELNGVPLVALYVWLPPDAAPGPWQVEVRSGGTRLLGSVQLAWPAGEPTLYVPTTRYDPFVSPSEMYTALSGHHTQLYRRKAGETLKLVGFNLPARQSFSLALYLLSYRRGGMLYKSIPVRTDAQGRLSSSLKVAANETPALYHVALVLDPAAGHARDAGPFVGLLAETCPGAPLSSLLLGDTVQLTVGTDLKANNLRSQPGLKGAKIGEFNLLMTAVVLEGPRCADKIVWWRVRTSAGEEGWTAEGQGTQRFLTSVR